MSNLSTQSYKGARDYFPEDKHLQNYIFKVWHATAQSFGYEEYGAPLLEPLDIYTAKSGQELAGEQTYLFTDRGGRQVAIRPEMTPSISRMVASRRQELAMPARLYSIANFMRYERPQRGREREFWQLNADLFGAEGSWADAEIIEFGYHSIMNFGAREDMFTVRVNNRQLINQLMSRFLGLDVIGAQMMTRLLDRKNKISPEAFREQAIEIFGSEEAKVGLPKLAQLISMRSVDDLPEELADSPSVQQLRQVMTLLRQKGIGNAMFDVTLMRGLDYYTGTVFEFVSEEIGAQSTICGGGRYDYLIEQMGGKPAPAVGWALGAERVLDLLREQGVSAQEPAPDAYAIVPDPAALPQVMRCLHELRAQGVSVQMHSGAASMKSQFKKADACGARFALIFGADELAAGEVTLKSLRDGVGAQTRHALAQVADWAARLQSAPGA